MKQSKEELTQTDAMRPCSRQLKKKKREQKKSSPSKKQPENLQTKEKKRTLVIRDSHFYFTFTIYYEVKTEEQKEAQEI